VAVDLGSSDGMDRMVEWNGRMGRMEDFALGVERFRSLLVHGKYGEINMPYWWYT
jgi:hypothetical protein